MLFMAVMLPATRTLMKLANGRRVAHYRALTGGFPDCRVIFCRFYTSNDEKWPCSRLHGLHQLYKHGFSQWMRRMVFLWKNLSYRHFWSATWCPNHGDTAYLWTVWLPYVFFWTGYWVKSIFILGNVTELREEADSRYPKNALINR